MWLDLVPVAILTVIACFVYRNHPAPSDPSRVEGWGGWFGANLFLYAIIKLMVLGAIAANMDKFPTTDNLYAHLPAMIIAFICLTAMYVYCYRRLQSQERKDG